MLMTMILRSVNRYCGDRVECRVMIVSIMKARSIVRFGAAGFLELPVLGALCSMNVLCLELLVVGVQYS